VATPRICAHLPLAQRLAQGLVGKQFAQHRLRAGLLRRIGIGDQQARPQHHAVGPGLAAGHAQRKGVSLPGGAAGALTSRRGLRACPGRQGPGQSDAVQITSKHLVFSPSMQPC